MAQVTLRGNAIHTTGELPATGAPAPAFKLTGLDLQDVDLSTYAGKRVILNIFPSVDTPTCATSVRHFNTSAAALENTVVLCVSADLPFAQKRFCAAEGIENVAMLSGFRHPEFATTYGLKIQDGPMAGLMARAVVVIDPAGKTVYTELVSEIGHEPHYDKALAAAK